MSLQHAPVTLNKPLCIGSSGPQVRTLQARLNESQIGPAISVDGKFGRRTHKLLVAFQRQQGLRPDGVVGQRTAAALGWGYSGGSGRIYRIRMDAPPRNEMGGPIPILLDTIHDGMRLVKDRLKQDIRTCGARPDKIANALDAIEDPGFSTFFALLNMTTTRGDMIDFAVVNLYHAMLEFSVTALRIGEYLMDNGGHMRPFARRIGAVSAKSIAASAERVLRGEQVLEIAISQIQMTFRNATRML